MNVRRRTAWRGLTTWAAALVFSGCFSYRPAELGTVSPGGEVRLEMTRIGFASLPEMANNSGPGLSGRVVRNEGERLLVRVPVAVRTDGLLTRTLEQEVAIPASQIVWVRTRVFNRARTGVALAGGLAVLGALIAAFGDGGPPSSEPPEGPPDDEAGSARIPSFSISIPLFR